jgi:hypothetical protein
MRSVKIALAMALALVAVAVGAVLFHHPLGAVGANAVEAPLYRNGGVFGNASSCEKGETVPRGTTAIRISLGANVDPRITVKVFAGSRLITQGERSPGGGLNASATVPVERVSETVHDARVCMSLGPSEEPIGIRGIPVQRPADGNVYELQGVELRMEYMQPGPSSWWSLITPIAYHFGLGRAASGTWIVFLVLALMLTVVALASSLALKELR